MDEVTKKLIDAGLEETAKGEQAARSGHIMVTINSPDGPKNVPVELGMFMLLDAIAVRLETIQLEIQAARAEALGG